MHIRMKISIFFKAKVGNQSLLKRCVKWIVETFLKMYWLKYFSSKVNVKFSLK